MSRTPFSQWLVLVTAVVALSWSPVARGDAVTDWNTIAVDTISAASPPRPGPVPFLDIAVVQAAIHDAVQAIGGKYKPYKVEISGASGRVRRRGPDLSRGNPLPDRRADDASAEDHHRSGRRHAGHKGSDSGRLRFPVRSYRHARHGHRLRPGAAGHRRARYEGWD